MRAKQIIEILDNFCNPNLVDSWDNTGFQIGNDEIAVSKILLSLDLDDRIANKAINENYQMIITHHPILFRPLNSINNNNYLGRLILKLISNGILVYNAHSNLDLTNGGVNDVLADKLDIKNTRPLNLVKVFNQVEQYGYGRVGEIDKIDADKYLYKVKEALDVNDIRVYGDTDRQISRVAVCGGSGGDFIKDAYESGADMYITGDIKYHEAQLGIQLGLIIVDAGHFHTEKFVLPKLEEVLEKQVGKNIYICVDMETEVSYKIY